MAESVLIGAALGGGTAALSGNDMLTGMAVGGAAGGATAGFGGAGVDSAVSTTNPALVSAGSTAPASTVATGATTNPALTNGMGKSSNPFTQFGRDAYQNVGQHVDKAFNNVTDTIGQGFDWVNDKTGMENKDWTQMGLSQGAQLMQPDPQQPIQAAPMGQGISRPNVDLSKSAGSLLTSNPLLQEELRKRQGLL
jgi:hypothetical protein